MRFSYTLEGSAGFKFNLWFPPYGHREYIQYVEHKDTFKITYVRHILKIWPFLFQWTERVVEDDPEMIG